MPELMWNGKEEAVKVAGRVPYRLLKEDRNLGYGVDSENMLIQGTIWRHLNPCYPIIRDVSSAYTLILRIIRVLLLSIMMIMWNILLGLP